MLSTFDPTVTWFLCSKIRSATTWPPCTMPNSSRLRGQWAPLSALLRPLGQLAAFSVERGVDESSNRILQVDRRRLLARSECNVPILSNALGSHSKSSSVIVTNIFVSWAV